VNSEQIVSLLWREAWFYSPKCAVPIPRSLT
jgi:hypothetical protein